MKMLLIVLLCILSLSQSQAQTNISGGIYADTTWTKANSPYILDGSVVVFQGVNLTIEPGTTIMFKGAAQIELRGTLTAIGTATDSIYFTAWAVLTPGSYKGIVIKNPAPSVSHQLTMKYCVVKYASDFITFKGGVGPYSFDSCHFSQNAFVCNDITPYDTVSFDHCLFDNNIFPLNGYDDKFIVTNSSFINNKKGINGGRIKNCFFTGHTEYAAYLYNGIDSCVFYNNNVGIRADFHGGTRVVNSIICYNQVGLDIERMWQDPSIVFIANSICHNSTWNILYEHINNVDISHNCWCSNDSLLIRSKIRDGYMNTGYGLLEFSYNDTCSVPYSPPPTTDIITRKGSYSMAVYPNPAYSQAYIEFNNQPGHLYDVVVTDVTGKIWMRNSRINTGKYRLDIQALPSGMYFVRLCDNNTHIATSKLIVQ